MLECRDAANKSEYGRMTLTQQKVQQNVGGVGIAMVAENKLHQEAQSAAGGFGSHDASSSQVQESERPCTAESSIASGNDQSYHQSSSSNEIGQNSLRQNNTMGLVISAASAFDTAKEIMDSLRSKHNNVASELEVIVD